MKWQFSQIFCYGNGDHSCKSRLYHCCSHQRRINEGRENPAWQGKHSTFLWRQRHIPWVYYWPTRGRQVSSLPKLNQCNSREVSWAVQVCPIIETKSFQHYFTQHLLCKLYLSGCPNPRTGPKIRVMHLHCREHIMEMRGENKNNYDHLRREILIQELTWKGKAHWGNQGDVVVRDRRG